MNKFRHTTFKYQQNGLALLTVLWMVALLTVIAAAVSYTLRHEARLTSHNVQTAQARALVDGAIFLGIRSLLAEKPTDVIADGYEREVRIGGKPLTLSIQDERGKVDINQASEELLQTLIQSAGANLDVLAITQSILDWRDEDDELRPLGAEDTQYQQAGLSYAARDGPFLVPDELQQVLGMTEAVYKRLAEHVTVYTGSTGVDPRSISQTLLAQMPGMSEGLATQYVQQRHNVDVGVESHWLPTESRPFLVKHGPEIYQITASMNHGDSLLTRYAIVHIKRQKKQPYDIIAWRDKFNFDEVNESSRHE